MTNDRAAFEKWFTDDGKWPAAVSQTPSGAYVLAAVASAWNTWQAAHAAGMRAGIERAAEVCEGVGATDNGLRTWQRCCAAIRALEGK